MIAEASFESQGKSVDLQSEAAGGFFLSDQVCLCCKCKQSNDEWSLYITPMAIK